MLKAPLPENPFKLVQGGAPGITSFLNSNWILVRSTLDMQELSVLNLS